MLRQSSSETQDQDVVAIPANDDVVAIPANDDVVAFQHDSAELGESLQSAPTSTTKSTTDPAGTTSPNNTSLKNLAIRGSVWTIGGYGATQVLRLGGNLILTRLLFPEAFGLMALIQVFMQGLAMFSDVGIGPSIIQNKRGDEPDFLNTAWTIQVVRGFALWLCACLGAWPFAMFYGSSELGSLIMVGGVSAVIAGFNSTKLFTANRHLALRSITLIEVGCQVLGLTTAILLVVANPSVWSLVYGGLVGTSLKMLSSHLLLPGGRNRFAWNRDAAHSLVHFGKWIFLSTMLGFLLAQLDRLVLGKFMSPADLGVYGIAAMLSGAVFAVHSRIGSKVLFSVYSKMKDLPLDALRQNVRKVRIILISCFLPILWGLVLFGDKIVEMLYDSRYHEASWMVQVLAAGWIPMIIATIGPVFLAQGRSRLQMVLMVVRLSIMVLAMISGGVMYGSVGVVVGIACTNICYYPVQVFVFSREKLWMPKLDLVCFLVSGAVLYIGFSL